MANEQLTQLGDARLLQVELAPLLPFKGGSILEHEVQIDGQSQNSLKTEFI